MAKVVQSQDFPEVQRRHRKYPWDEWEDGRIWEITGDGKDFDVTPRYMQTQLHVRARHVGRIVTTRVVDNKITEIELVPTRSRTEGLFNLISSVDKPILDVAVEWAAKVNSIARRGRA